MYGSRQMARTGYQIKAGANTRIIKKINEIHGQNLPIFSANQTVTELSSYRDSDESRDAGWDVRDARGRSARVFTPGSRPRTRREKKKSERVEHIRKVRNVAIGVATLHTSLAQVQSLLEPSAKECAKGSSVVAKQ